MRRNLSNILWGLFWIGMGVAIALSVAGYFSIWWFVREWWPLFIIVPSVIGMVRHGFEGGSFVGLVIGGLLLFYNLGYIDASWIRKMLLPIILILIGLQMILKNAFNGTRRVSPETLQRGDMESAAVFSTQRMVMPPAPFYGGKVDAVFGTLRLDLSQAYVNEDIVIKASAIFGSVHIQMPPNVKVKASGTSFFGGRDNRAADVQDPQATIYVDTCCMFGGVNIR